MTQSGKHGIFYGISQNLLKCSVNTFYSTVNVHMAIALFCVNLRIIQATLCLNYTIWKTRNLPRNIPQNFLKSLKTDSTLFQMVKIYPCVSWCSVFSRLCYFRQSIACMILKVTQNNAMAIWNINCGVESVNGTFQQVLRSSVFYRLCHIR